MADMTTLGKYEIRRELGRGAMGVVYEGYDPMIKRVVALKTIRADQLAGENAEIVVARFRREAQAAGRLSHPNIVPIYDFGEDNGVWYIAMEFVEGRELKDYFQANERFATADIVRIMTQILDALGYSHRLGVIHRDIKPSNVILLAGGGVKVADFGIAHIESSNMTQVGTVLGTPSYMSPEQIMGLPVDGRSDLFSAGVILYQFLTGERPFTGSATATMQKVLAEDPLPPSRFNVQAPGAMDAIVRKALAKRPDERYQTAEDFAAALFAAAQGERPTAGEPTLIAPASRAAPLATEAAATATIVNPGPDGPAKVAAPPPKKSQAAAIAIVVGIAVVAVIAGLWTALHRSAADSARIAQAPSSAASAPGSTLPSASAPPPPSAPVSPAAPVPATASPSPAAAAPTPKSEPGMLTIAAEGLVNPGDPRFGSDKALLQSELRADAKSQLVAKALGLLLEPDSLTRNYDLLSSKVLAQSGAYVATVVAESPPRMGKDGLMSMTTQGVVNLKALQKSLNQMSREERVDLIRTSGDPKIAVRIVARDADRPDAPAQPSPVAENLLKERIKAFGFRTWSDDGERAADGRSGANFAIDGEVRIRKLATRLEASGIVVTKYTLASWTVKCVDRETGEEIYFNTTLPKVLGSWASEAEAMRAIGAKVADEFSRNFFLQHVTATGRKVVLIVDGLPDSAPDDVLARELVGLSAVLVLTPRANTRPRAYDLQLAGNGPEGDLVANRVLKPLNAKLGQACFTLGRVVGEEVSVTFDGRCADPAIVSRLETNPPAGLYGAPPARQKAVIRDPETLRRLTI